MMMTKKRKVMANTTTTTNDAKKLYQNLFDSGVQGDFQPTPTGVVKKIIVQS